MEPPPEFDADIYFKAVCEGDMSTLQGIVAQFGQLWYPGLQAPCGSNALHWAASSRKTSTCRFLIEKLNFDVNVANENGATPLLQAIKAKHRPTIIFMINNGADVNKCTVTGESPLHLVAAGGTKELVKLLVSKGADLYAASDSGMPLHYAAGTGNRETLECLLDLKADPNPTSVVLSPLFLSMNAKSPACLELLLKAGADPNRPCHRATPLRFAAAASDVGIIKHLLKAGANPNTLDCVGHTPLEHAALCGREKVVKILFPVTSRIASYRDWSPRGVMQHAQSKEAKALFKSKLKEAAQLAKTEGRDAFERKRYVDAINWYIQAVEADPTDTKVLFNRSLCYSKMNRSKEALDDAQACIELEPGWAKAHYREGAVWKAFQDYEKAAGSFSRALALEPGNKDIQEAYREAVAELNKGVANRM